MSDRTEPTVEYVAERLRSAIEALMARSHDDRALAEAGEAAAAIESSLSSGDERPLEERLVRFGVDMFDRPDLDQTFESFSRSPVAGRLNPLSAAEVMIRRVGDTVEAEVLLGVAHEGAPGRAHGGMTAALFDEVMGAAQKVIGRHGYTKSLTVEYLAPFPIGEKVVFRVELASESPRTFVLAGRAMVDGSIIATSIGTFTQVTAERFTR